MCHSLGVFKMEICLLEEGTVENLQFCTSSYWKILLPIYMTEKSTVILDCKAASCSCREHIPQHWAGYVMPPVLTVMLGAL